MREKRLEIEDEDTFGGEYGDTIVLTINDMDEEGNQIIKILPADTVYVKINREEGSIMLCSKTDFEDEEEIVAEIRMPADMFEDFIKDIEKFIRNRKIKQTNLDQFFDEE